MERRCYSIQEFAKLFGISRSFTWKLHYANRLAFAKIGGRTVITQEEADRFAREEVTPSKAKSALRKGVTA